LSYGIFASTSSTFICREAQGKQISNVEASVNSLIDRLKFVPYCFRTAPMLGLRPSSVLCKVLCKELHMATNLALDPDLINRAVKVSGEKTKRAAVTRALEEFISRRSQARLVDLMGKLEWDDSFDYKAERTRR
jgi:Arc/MetJ family transcription regulator